MKRLYFLAPDVASAKAIVDELLLARVEERHMHVLAKRGTPLEALPEASVLQKSDFLPATQRGLAMGGVAGTLAGLVAISLPAANLVIAGGVILASTLAGAGVGAWLGGMVGMNVGNTRLKRFERAIAKGELLMMIDVPVARVEEITQLIKRHHPEAEVKGVEPTIPAFP
ncbi:MAG: DUF1269 domain-containing protein [Betaproteobacteria bacterium]|nr:MAG: DUF1269 domain-containing protein [Betaproteobacteria bacterium]